MRRALYLYLAWTILFLVAGELPAAKKAWALRKNPANKRASRPAKYAKQEEKKKTCTEKDAVVSVPKSDVFARSSATSERVSEVLLGDEFKVLSEEKDWFYGSIPSQKGYRGWIKKENVLVQDHSPLAKDAQLVQVRNAKARITFMDGSFINVFAGTRLPLVGKEPRRYQVMVPDGSTGFLPAEAALLETELSNREIRAEDILQASKFYGSDYKWGGITAGGMDCSGFVYTAFRLNGILLKRDSYLQAEEGSEVSFDELNPGDLVFFKPEKANRITHVGIYVGDGNFIHSSRTNRGVAVSSLSDGNFRKNFAGARRILIRRDNAVPKDEKEQYQKTASKNES